MELEQAIQRVLDLCKKFHIVPGIHTNSSDQAKERIGQGFRFVTVQSDAIMLKNASVAALNDLRQT